ncbi:hypothetical protein PENTCL1PPCAC_14440, partial [Pristionchus entomophagus]
HDLSGGFRVAQISDNVYRKKISFVHSRLEHIILRSLHRIYFDLSIRTTDYYYFRSSNSQHFC